VPDSAPAPHALGVVAVSALGVVAVSALAVVTAPRSR
jgi:hypothetical protein